MRTVTLNTEQQREVEILTRLVAGVLDIGTAAELLGVSTRQVRRLRTRFQQDGMAAVVHGNTGRTPANSTAPDVCAAILQLAGPGGKYHDLNVCHMQELLEHAEQIIIGRSTLARLLKEAGLRKPAKRGPPVHRRQRLRRSAEGMLLQIDGSPFAWLEGRGPQACLTGAIDDATGKIVFLLFRPTEDQIGYLLLLRTVAQRYGLPMAIYHDRHTILRSPKQPTIEEQLAGQTPMSQLQRIMAELGIEAIPAHSPQAKGRIERLWGTLQDRLTKELRLGGIATLEAANAWLPGFIERFNKRFAQAPQDPQHAWVPLPADLDLHYYFAIRETRQVRADHCISFQGQTLQLLPGRKDPSLVQQSVAVHRVPEGELYVYQGKRPIAYQPYVAPAVDPPQPQAEAAAQPKAQARKSTPGQRRWLHARS
jgi:transposase